MTDHPAAVSPDAPADSFDLDAFSAENLARCTSPSGFNHALDSWSLSDWMTATLGELGEAANVAKKLNRVRDGIKGNRETEDELRGKLASEIADAFIYLDLMAQSQGIRLSKAVRRTFDAKSAQIGYAAAPRPAGPTSEEVPSLYEREATEARESFAESSILWEARRRFANFRVAFNRGLSLQELSDSSVAMLLVVALASARAALDANEEKRSQAEESSAFWRAECDTANRENARLQAALSEATRREEEAFVAGFVDGATGGKLSASSESVRAEARHNARNYVAIRAALVAAETEITILKDQRDERADERNEASGQIEALQAALSEATRDTRLLDLLAVSGPGIWERLGRRYDWERSTPALLRAAIGAEIPNGAERLASRAALPEETSNGH